MIISRWIAVAVVGAFACGGAARPAAASPRQAPVPVAAAPATSPAPAAQEGYSYKPEGRRDPFVSLLSRAGGDNRPTKKRPEGIRGFMFSEIALRGIMQGGTPRAVALVQGPDMRTYLLHIGDYLFDGVVKAISADSIVVQQEVNDPLSLAKQREVRKTLRVVEEVK